MNFIDFKELHELPNTTNSVVEIPKISDEEIDRCIPSEDLEIEVIEEPKELDTTEEDVTLQKEVESVSAIDTEVSEPETQVEEIPVSEEAPNQESNDIGEVNDTVQ